MARADRHDALIQMGQAAVRIAIETFGSPGWREMVALRDRVLRAPLGLVFTEHQLEAEGCDRHLALRLDDALAGTLLIGSGRHRGTAIARFRQMAIDPARQGSGLGARLLDAGERLASREGARIGLLHARVTAEGFYARQGWIAAGDIFDEVTLPHVRMTKALEPSRHGSS